MEYIEGLNSPQKQAVLYTEGPLMVIAGAGSGKTRVLTNRIAHLMHEGNNAWNILALTFTNKAAGEMRARIEKIVGTDAKSLWMGTFHSIFAKILRFEADKIGFTSSFSIYDTDDSKSLIKSIIKEFGLDDKVYKPNQVFSRISNFKNKMVDAQNYAQSPTYFQEDRNNKMPEFGRIYKAYQIRSFKANAMDFDDLLFNTNKLFEQHAEVLQKYQEKFRYILIDEFQDTNFAQYLIVRRLSGKYKNICVVGDDAQSIYAFRGADIANILNFEKDFPDLKVIRLEQNYRSTQNIVKAANSIIAKNKGQLEKNVWTDNDEGTKIKVTKAISDKEEGKWVASTIFQNKQNYGYDNKDFAILYRTNAQSRSVEDALRNQNIKYRIIGGLSFYQRKEIKDLIAYLRFTVNQQDEEAFKRIINLPKRGIGKSTVEKLLAFSREYDLSIWEIASSIKKYMTGRNVGAIEKFATLIDTFIIIEQEKDAFETAQEIGKMSGLLKELYEDKTIEGLSRYENVQELLNAIKEFTDDPEKEDKSLSAFLQEVSLLTNADEAKDDEESKVTLMTIHAAKGLEFKNVFVIGMEENLFPSQMMVGSRKDLEEERRLFYVAVTRAEEKLMLSYCDSRYVYGRIMDCSPSRFLKEIDPKFLEEDSIWSRKVNTDYERDTSFVRNLKPVKKTSFVKKQTYVPSEDFAPSDTSNLQSGMKVEHIKFGFGDVVEVEVYNNDRKAKINFDNVGEKTLLLSFAKLRILN